MSLDVMSVRLHLRGVRVTGVVVDTPAELVVGVVSVRKLSSCPFCGHSCQKVHDRRRRESRDLEHGGLLDGVVVDSAAVRVRCIVGNGTWKPIPSSKAVLPGGWPGGWSGTLR